MFIGQSLSCGYHHVRMCARNTSECAIHAVGFREFHYELANMAASIGQFCTPFYKSGCRLNGPLASMIFLRNLVREIWFKKNGSSNLDSLSGLRKLVDQKKKVVLYYKSTFFQVGEKWFCKLRFSFLVRKKRLTRRKNPSLKDHFSRTKFPTIFQKSGCRLNG